MIFAVNCMRNGKCDTNVTKSFEGHFGTFGQNISQLSEAVYKPQA